jgi:hypothetical protein
VYDICYTYSTLLPVKLLTTLHVLPHFSTSSKTALFQERFGKTCFNLIFPLNVLIFKVPNFVTLFTAKVVTVADDYPYIFLIALVEPPPYDPGTCHVTGVLVQGTVISSCPKRGNGLFRQELSRQSLICGFQRR